MEESILNSTKKMLGIVSDYEVFDLDIIIHINSAFSTLSQLGVGPEEGFMIEDDEAEWSDFVDAGITQNWVKTYLFLRVRLMFDPPSTSYVIAALERQITEQESRLSIHRESTDWTDPDPPVVVLENE